MKRTSEQMKSVHAFHGMTNTEFNMLDVKQQEEYIWLWLKSPEYMESVINKNADMIMGLRQDKEHLEMEIDMLKVNLENLCDEVCSYRELWFVRLYNWIKRVDLPSCEELMSGKW